MALRVNTTGNVLLRNVGRDGPEGVDTTASVAVKRKYGETTYSLRATESTIKNIRALNGALVQMSKPLGERHGRGIFAESLSHIKSHDLHHSHF